MSDYEPVHPQHGDIEPGGSLDGDHDITHCKHGTYIGYPGGPDYMCGWCEDGVDPHNEVGTMKDRLTAEITLFFSKRYRYYLVVDHFELDQEPTKEATIRLVHEIMQDMSLSKSDLETQPVQITLSNGHQIVLQLEDLTHDQA